MNHDYAHCSDWSPDCPKDCFRAQLVMDLKQRTDLLGLPFTWMSFKGTSECKKFQSTRPLRDGTHGSHCLSRAGTEGGGMIDLITMLALSVWVLTVEVRLARLYVYNDFLKDRVVD